MANYLVVANETAESPELLRAVTDIHTHDPDSQFVLVVPATPLNLLQQFEGTARSARALAAQRAQNTRRNLEDHGIRVKSARIGSWDPFVAIEAEVVQQQYEAIVISTLPPGLSRWLRMDLQSRIARRHPDIRLIHIVAQTGPARRGG